MCERALGRPAPERVQSELYEFLGISSDHLLDPPHDIQRAFESAIRVDPSNDRARQNLERFLEALATTPTKPVRWDQPNETYIRNSGLQQTQRSPMPSQQREFAWA